MNKDDTIKDKSKHTDEPLSRAMSLIPLLVVASLITGAVFVAGLSVNDKGNSSFVDKVARRL